jgi:hypothetical protein
MSKSAIALVALLLALGGAELGARYLLGLGTPPLIMPHPKIEYMFVPNQDVLRFGNRQLYNEFGMRSIRMEKVTQQRRVLVLGDSVVNGGNQTDHADLATTLATNDKIFFGNVSAGSWGPANMRAWINQYGILGADTLIVVLSSHDLSDIPTFAPLDPLTHPTEKPFSAFIEGVERYLPLYIPTLLTLFTSSKSAPLQVPRTDTTISADSLQGEAEIRAFIDGLGSEIALCLVQHKTLSELEGRGASTVNTASNLIRELFQNRGVPTIDLSSEMRAALQRGEVPFRDDIHLNEKGQALLAGSLQSCADIARRPTQAK